MCIYISLREENNNRMKEVTQICTEDLEGHSSSALNRDRGTGEGITCVQELRVINYF
jgi:hypothetical protein